MAFRVSAALRNALLESQPLKLAMANCVLKVYSGSQPATADAAPTGTLLCTYSASSGALTREVLAQGSVALTGGASGSLDTLTVNSLEIMGSATSYDTSLVVTATNIVTKINNNPKNQLIVASNAGGTSATITLTVKPGVGVVTWTVASTATTITKTDTNIGTTTAGTAPVNTLNWGDSAAGVLSKLSTQTWSGVAGNTGTAGWFRMEAAVTDTGALDSAEAVSRFDGAISTSGAELNLSSTSITSGATQTVDTFTITLPTS